MKTLLDLTHDIQAQESEIRQGGGTAGQERQRRLGRLTARERVESLLDPGTKFYELGVWSAWGMYSQWGSVPAAGVIVGIGIVQSRFVMVVANDATVKAGAFFPQTVKKVLRAQRIAFSFRLPLVYLVDSSGVFLPLQDEIFPDEDDFGRIFRNNAVISAAGIPQYSAVMGNCVAGGAYLPVLSDTLLMTEGSQLYLAGPALVKAAIGQTADPEELGGAKMHAEISGTVDYREPDDPSCISRLRSLIELLPSRCPVETPAAAYSAERDQNAVYSIAPGDGRGEFDVRELLKCVVDVGSINEFRAEYGETIVTVHARIGGLPVGIVANQCQRCRSASGELQIGGVIYADSAEKAARFVMECNQTGVPIIFFQNVQGFMVGRQSEQAGIIRSGAKLVNVVSNTIVPKLTVIIGGSFGAGNYALCGKAYDPWLILAWPGARYAVMGADQAADTLLSLKVRDAERGGKPITEEERRQLRDDIRQCYAEQMDIRHGAARGWVDAIIAPQETRRWLELALRMIPATVTRAEFRTGMIQM